MYIFEKLFDKVGYLACLKDIRAKDNYTINLANNAYHNSISELIAFVNNPSSNYMSIPNDIDNYIKDTTYDFGKCLKKYNFDKLLKITDKKFVSCMTCYLAICNLEGRYFVEMKKACFPKNDSRKYNSATLTLHNNVNIYYDKIHDIERTLKIMFNNEIILETNCARAYIGQNILIYQNDDKTYLYNTNTKTRYEYFSKCIDSDFSKCIYSIREISDSVIFSERGNNSYDIYYIGQNNIIKYDLSLGDIFKVSLCRKSLLEYFKFAENILNKNN